MWGHPGMIWGNAGGHLGSSRADLGHPGDQLGTSARSFGGCKGSFGVIRGFFTCSQMCLLISYGPPVLLPLQAITSNQNPKQNDFGKTIYHLLPDFD